MRRSPRAGLWLLLLVGCTKGSIGVSPPQADAARKPDVWEPPEIIHCFAAGTRIATPGGEVAIERLRVGDAVQAFDIARGRVVESRVTAVHVHPGQITGRLPLGSGRLLRVTSEHPVYRSDRRDFAPAHTLTAGTPLVALGGEGAVAALAAGGFATPAGAAPETVYNLTVSGQENYFAEGVLVHNKSPPRCPGQYNHNGFCSDPQVTCDRAWPESVGTPEAARRLAAWLWRGDEAEAVAYAAQMKLDLRSDGHREMFVDWLLADRRGNTWLVPFTQRWLGLPDQAPGDVPAALWASFREETGRFLHHVLVENRGHHPLELLLQADFTFADALLAAHYGLGVDAGAGWTRVKVDPAQRGGLLSHGSILAWRRSGPARGTFVWEQLYQCSSFPPYPADHLNELGPGTPARSAVTAAYGGRKECLGCHNALDNLGWPLQSYDQLGRFRTLDSDGQPVDTSGWLEDSSMGVADQRRLTTVLLASRGANVCFLQRLLEQGLERAFVNVVRTAELAECVIGRRHQSYDPSFRGRLREVANVVVRDWERADGGLPEALPPAVSDAGAPDAAVDAAP